MVNMGDDAEIADMRCFHLTNLTGRDGVFAVPKIIQDHGTATLPKMEVKDNRKAVEEKEICRANGTG